MERTRSVKLREKTLTDGRKSLYLDFYPPIYVPETGKETRREFLKIYLHDKPANPQQKEYNRIGKAKAESIRSERELQFLNQNFDFTDRLNSKRDFLAYFKQQMIKRNKSKGNYDNWFGTYKYLVQYTNGKCTFGEVDERFCEGFKTFLEKVKSRKSEHSVLSQNTRYSYFNKFRACIKDAFHDRLFAINPISRVKAVAPGESYREFLTLEELQAIYETECEHPVLKRASIFCALSGLRWSDMIKLTWKEVQHSETLGHFIRFTQQKTKGMQTLPISDLAFEQMGEREAEGEKVFKGLKYSAHTNIQLARWIMKAGITKKITFHCFRHTFATLLLASGEDIYTTSKMIGHDFVKSTEIYSNISDHRKVVAANRIKLKRNDEKQ